MTSPDDTQRLYIGQVAELTGVSASSLRQWERQGLLTPQRSASGYRTYSQADIARCRHIRDLFAEDGLGVVAIRQVLAREAAEGEGDGPQRRAGERGAIGARLRHLRAQRGASLRDVAAQTGLSASYISSLERQPGRPSVATLQKLSAALGTTVIELLGDPTRDEPEDLVVRAGQRRRVRLGDPGVAIEQLTVREDMLEPSLMRLGPGAGSREPYTHDGEDFVYVLEGRFEVTLDERHRYELGPGDAITFRSHRPHRWRNPGEDETVLIWVNTPPTF
jgi:DNA-binding transcriptional MerR regulator/mannose-6-phosphate isomerase-like protein (cupin superfamily)